MPFVNEIECLSKKVHEYLASMTQCAEQTLDKIENTFNGNFLGRGSEYFSFEMLD